MTLNRRTFLGTTALAVASPATVLAQETYPSKVVKIIVPSVPGGATDIIGRTTASGLAKRWPRAVVVENKPGAGTSLGAEFVSKAAPDGYTLLIGGIASHAINPAVYKNLGYDPVKSFTPIGLLGTLANVLVASPSLPVNNIQELIALLRANPGKYSYASIGNGTSPHLSAELLWQMTGVKIVHVPYKGSAPALTDLMGGQVPLVIDNISAPVPFIKEGKMKALGVTTAARSPLLPDVKTIAEQGISGYEVASWAGLMGPAGMKPEVVKKLSADTMAMLKDPDTHEQFVAYGITPQPMTPEDFANFVASQGAKFKAIAHRANLQVG